jgi:tetratricopeptide (TPR) repeat protein
VDTFGALGFYVGVLIAIGISLSTLIVMLLNRSLPERIRLFIQNNRIVKKCRFYLWYLSECFWNYIGSPSSIDKDAFWNLYGTGAKSGRIKQVRMLMFQPVCVNVRQIVLDTRADAEEAYKRADAGEDFESLVNLLTVDRATKCQGGLVICIRSGGYIPEVIYNEEYEDVAFSMGKGEISRPFEVRGKWYVLKRLGERGGAVKEPYKIERSVRIRSYSYMDVEELLEAAEIADLSQAVWIFEEIYERFPDDEMADDALFTSGLIYYSKEQRDYTEATYFFERLLEEYPESYFVQTTDQILEKIRKEISDVIKKADATPND